MDLTREASSFKVGTFHSDGGFWECFTTISCESAPLGVHCFAEIDEDVITFYDKKPFTHSLWAWAVGVYSRAKLTVESDKISGLAQRIHSENGMKDIAGLWENEFASGLLWEVNSVGLPSSRPTRYLAPSWSWASSSGAIDIWKPEPGISIGEAFINIISAAVEPPNSFAQVTSGTLEMESKFLVAINLRQSAVLELGGMWESISIIVRKDCSEEGLEEPAYMVPVYFYLDWDVMRAIGLLLVPTGKKQGEYYRAGIFHMYAFNGRQNDDIRSSLPWAFFSHHLSKGTTPDDACAVVRDEEKRYHITVV